MAVNSMAAPLALVLMRFFFAGGGSTSGSKSDIRSPHRDADELGQVFGLQPVGTVLHNWAKSHEALVGSLQGRLPLGLGKPGGDREGAALDAGGAMHEEPLRA